MSWLNDPRATVVAALISLAANAQNTVYQNITEDPPAISCSIQYENLGRSIEKFPEAARQILKHVDPELEKSCGISAVLESKYGEYLKGPTQEAPEKNSP